MVTSVTHDEGSSHRQDKDCCEWFGTLFYYTAWGILVILTIPVLFASLGGLIWSSIVIGKLDYSEQPRWSTGCGIILLVFNYYALLISMAVTAGYVVGRVYQLPAYSRGNFISAHREEDRFIKCTDPQSPYYNCYYFCKPFVVSRVHVPSAC